jgi:RNA polymerase sigma factor (sigma-70 family)
MRITEAEYGYYVCMVERVAEKVRRKMPWSILELEDLISYGWIGLIDAASRFISDRNTSFEVFAVKRVRGAILDAVRALSWGRALNKRIKNGEIEMSMLNIDDLWSIDCDCGFDNMFADMDKEDIPKETNGIVSRTKLSRREKQVIKMINDGLDREEIADQLGVSREAVNTFICLATKKIKKRRNAEIAFERSCRQFADRQCPISMSLPKNT